MSKLTPAQRAAVPPAQMGLPPSGYPMPDASHAANAKSGASHALHVGNITPAQKTRIDSKANAILGHTHMDARQVPGHAKHGARGFKG